MIPEIADGAATGGRYTSALVAAVIGFVASLAAYLFVAHSIVELAETNFVNSAENRQAVLQSSLDGYDDVLMSLAMYFDTANHDVSDQQFLAFTRDLASRHPGIYALSWLPRVTREERAAFEAKARATVSPNYRITENMLTPNSATIQAGARSVYFPILYSLTQPGNTQVLGFDVPSDPRRTPLFQEAQDEGKPVAVGPVPLIAPGNAWPWGYAAFAPVYRWGKPHDTIEQRRTNLTGYVTGTFRIHDMLQGIMSQIGSPTDFNMYFYDPARKPGNRLLYWYSARNHVTTPPSEAALTALPHHAAVLKFIGRDLGVIFTPAIPWRNGFYHWQALSALIGGLAITVLATAYLVFAARRRFQLETLGRDLRETAHNLRLEATRRTASNQTLARLGTMFRAAAAAGNDLAEPQNGNLPFVKLLERIAVAAEADRAYILGERHNTDGQFAATERHEWHASDLASEFEASVLPHLDFRAVGLTRWAIKLQDGHPFAAVIRTLPPAERKFLEPTRLLSLVVAPIFVGGQWWGEIGLGYHRTEHVWTESEIDVVNTLADLVGASIARKRDVTALADAELIIRNSPIILYRLSPEPPFNMTYISNSIIRLGYDPAKFANGATFYRALFHPDDLPKLLERLSALGSEWGATPPLILRLRKDDGTYRWFENRFIPMRDRAGRLQSIAGIAADITDRKAVEEQLNISNALLALAMTASPDGFLIVDEKGKIVSSNRRFAEIFRIPPDVLATGQDESALQAALPLLKDQQGFLARVQYLYAHPEESSREAVEFKDGRIFERHTAPLIDENRRYIGRIWFFRDISERLAVAGQTGPADAAPARGKSAAAAPV